MSKIGNEYIDDLTGLYNRRYLNINTHKKIKQAKHKGESLSILMIDLDHFKNVNDAYGHSRGDAVLKAFGIFLKTMLRVNDTVFRYGGDEFVCILLNSDYKQAERFSHRLIEICREKEFSKIGLTLSIGISSFPRDAKSWQKLFDIADRNLYSAKRHGRDRIGVFESESKELNIPTAEIVGRDEEIGRVKEFVAPIFNGQGGAVCISGEIGVGKTRLVQEIAEDADFHSIQFLSSNLSATTRSISYYPFREIIRAIIEDCGIGFIKGIPRAYQVELMKIVPELSTGTEKKEHIYMVDKFRLFEGVRKFLECRASDVPLFIFLDNVHWADDVSLDLLHYLVRTLRESPIYFFLVYRIEEAREELFKDVLSFMSREGLYERVELESLKKPDVARILSFILDCNPSSELTEYIIKETGGNPFFIEELMKSLKANDALLWNKGEWTFDKERKVIIPYSVEGVVERKMGMIEDESYNLLEYAAVLGKEFDFKFLQDITGMNEGHLFDLIDEILEVRLLREFGGERYYFSEDIIREIIYGNIGGAKLKRYHQKVGEKLLDLYKGRIEEVVEELAYHFYECGDWKKAIEYSMTSGDRARDAYANKDAIRFYTRAIKCLSDRTIEEWELKEIACLGKRANVLNMIGENEKAIIDLKNAIKISKKIGNKKKKADCLAALSKIYLYIAHYNDAIINVKKALKIYRELNDRKGEANSLNTLGITYWYLSEYQSALKFYRISLDIAKEFGGCKLEAMLLGNIAIVYWDLGEYYKALEYYKKSLKINREIGDRKTEAVGSNNIGLIHWSLGEYSKALKYYKSSLKITKEIGFSNIQSSTLNNLGIVFASIGEYSKALEYYKSSLKINKEIDDRKTEAQNSNNIGIIYKYLGEYSQALEYCNNSLKIAKEVGDHKTRAESLLGIGDTFLEVGDFSNAEEYYTNAISIAREIKSKPLITEIFIGLISLYLKKNSFDKAKQNLKQVLSLIDELHSMPLKADSLCLSARLYTKEKKWNKAESSFKEAISIFKKLKKKFKLAEVYYYQGLMFKESGDKTEAKKYYAKAKTIFKDIGAKGWIEKIKAK